MHLTEIKKNSKSTEISNCIELVVVTYLCRQKLSKHGVSEQEKRIILCLKEEC